MSSAVMCVLPPCAISTSEAPFGDMECPVADFVILVPKKLSSAWSAGGLTRQLSPSLLDAINSNFHSLEKKVKMRILLSFLGLDASRRSELSQSLLHSLRLAAEEETSEVWVAVTARLVYERLFGGGGDEVADDDNGVDAVLGSSSRREHVLSETSDAIIHRLIEWSSTDAADDESSSYFQPIEYKYLSPSWVAQMQLESTANKDLRFVGAAPDFIAREKERLSHLMVHKQQEGSTSLMRVKMDNSSRDLLQLGSSSSSSSSAGEGGNGRAEIKKLKPPGAADKRGTSKLISLDDIKAAAEAGIKARGPEKVSGAKRKAATAATATASATTAGATATTTTAAVAATGASKAAPASESLFPTSGWPMPLEGVSEESSGAGPAVAHPEYAPISIDTDALFAESPLLSEEDREIIATFFSEDWASKLPPNLPPRRMKMREVETPAGKTETFTIVLNFADHSYQKTKKVKTTKVDRAEAI